MYTKTYSYVRTRSGFYFGTPSSLGHLFSLISYLFSSIFGMFVRQMEIRGHTILDLDGSFHSQVIPENTAQMYSSLIWDGFHLLWDGSLYSLKMRMSILPNVPIAPHKL